MATITKRRAATGAISFVALVRVAGFKSHAQTFRARLEAKRWAETLESNLRKQRSRGGVRTDLATLTVGSLILEFLADPETTRLRTFDDLHRLCSWWIQLYGALRAIELNVLVLREARERLSKGRAPATVNRYLSAMRSAWNWARSSGFVSRDHLWPERLMLTEPKGRTRFLSDGELKSLLGVARDHSNVMHAAVLVSVATGVRQGELLRLNWSDVDLARQTLRIQLSKNDDSRTVYLPQTAVDALRSLKDDKVRALGPVFIHETGERVRKTTLEVRWHAIRSAAGLKDFRWHDLRHSCASFLAQQGATLMQIGAQLGHRSPSMSMRYAHLVQGSPLPAHMELDKKLRG